MFKSHSSVPFFENGNDKDLVILNMTTSMPLRKIIFKVERQNWNTAEPFKSLVITDFAGICINGKRFLCNLTGIYSTTSYYNTEFTAAIDQ